MLEYVNAEHLALIPPMLAYGLLFAICILEGMPIIGSIVAGGTITIAIGTVAHTGVIDPITAIVIASIGSLIGDLVGFFALRHYGNRIGFLRRLIAAVRDNQGRLSDTFDRQYFMITVVSRLVPVVRSTPSLIAAVRAVPARGYVLASIVASALWATTGVAAGYGLSEIIDPKYIIATIIVFCVFSASYGLYKHLRSTK